MRLLVTVPDEAAWDEQGNFHNEFKEALYERLKKPLELCRSIEVCCWASESFVCEPLDDFLVSGIVDTNDWYKSFFGRKTGKQIIRECVERADVVLIVGPCRIGKYAASICHAMGKPYTIEISEEYKTAMDGNGLGGAINYLLMASDMRKLTANAVAIR